MPEPLAQASSVASLMMRPAVKAVEAVKFFCFSLCVSDN